MKRILMLLTAVLMTAGLTACGDKGDAAKPDAPKTATPTAAPKKDEARPAVYDPNLKPGPIVWDSPEKKKEFEARQAAAAKK